MTAHHVRSDDTERKLEGSVLDERYKDALIRKHIERPGRAEAVVKGTRLHVWALIGHMGAVDGSVVRVARYYHLPVEVVQAAVAYYEQNKCFINGKLEANRVN